MWYGDREGENWSDPVILPFNGIVPDKFLQLKNGRLIISNHRRNEENNKLEQHLWYSDDEGKTWSDRITVASDDRYNLCEVSILECDNNTLIGFLRENSFKGYDLLKVLSYDNGESWSPVYNTPIDCGHRPTSGFLNDGTVMITYRYLPTRGHNRNVFVAFLNKEDLLKTERQNQEVCIMPLDYDRNNEADLGYIGWTQFDDGEIYVVNYIKDGKDIKELHESGQYNEVAQSVGGISAVLEAMYEAEANALLHSPFPSMLGHFFAAHSIANKYSWFNIQKEHIPIMGAGVDKIIDVCKRKDCLVDITGIHEHQDTVAYRASLDGFLHEFQKEFIEKCRQNDIGVFPGSDAHRLTDLEKSLHYHKLFSL